MAASSSSVATAAAATTCRLFIGNLSRGWERTKLVALLASHAGIQAQHLHVTPTETTKPFCWVSVPQTAVPALVALHGHISFNDAPLRIEEEKKKKTNTKATKKKTKPRQEEEKKSSKMSLCASEHPLVDIGVNLTNRKFSSDLHAVIKRSVAAGVPYLILTGTSKAGSLAAVKMVRKLNASEDLQGGGFQSYATVGVHPHDAKTCDTETLHHFRELLTAHPEEIVAVGETGLDFNRNFSPQETQIRWFEEHVKLAVELQKPMFLHEREAHIALMTILKKFPRDKLPPIVIHCFTGTEKEARAYIKMGFYIGLTTFICKGERGREGREMLQRGAIPLDRLMIETDSPFMLPDLVAKDAQLYRFKQRRNEPCTLPLAVTTIAKALGTSQQEVAQQTTANAKLFFALK